MPQPSELVDLIHGKQQDGERGSQLFRGIRPVNREGALRDALAGFTSPR